MIPFITTLPQYHFSGKKDKIVPPYISQEFVNGLKKLGSHCAKSMILQDASHHHGWEKHWQNLLSLPVECAS